MNDVFSHFALPFAKVFILRCILHGILQITKNKKRIKKSFVIN